METSDDLLPQFLDTLALLDLVRQSLRAHGRRGLARAKQGLVLQCQTLAETLAERLETRLPPPK
jgi:hypothetical protein